VHFGGLGGEGKDTFLVGVGVDVEEHAQLFLTLQILLHIRLYQLNFNTSCDLRRLILLSLLKEMPIHIFPLQVASIIAYNHTIWVNNRHDPPVKLLSQGTSVRIIRNQEVYHTVDDETGIGFARMLPPNDHYYRFIRHRVTRRDAQNGNT